MGDGAGKQRTRHKHDGRQHRRDPQHPMHKSSNCESFTVGVIFCCISRRQCRDDAGRYAHHDRKRQQRVHRAIIRRGKHIAHNDLVQIGKYVGDHGDSEHHQAVALKFSKAKFLHQVLYRYNAKGCCPVFAVQQPPLVQCEKITYSSCWRPSCGGHGPGCACGCADFRG